MLSTALTLVLFAAGSQPTPTPAFSLDTPDPRAPIASEEWSGWSEPVATPAPAPARKSKSSKKGTKAANKSLLGHQPVIVGGIESAFATIELVQGEIDEMWTITLDGGKVGQLAGREARLRVAMVPPGKHDLAIFNERGTLWSGRVDVRSNQILVLEAMAAGLQANDPMALQSHAELREERVANGR